MQKERNLKVGWPHLAVFLLIILTLAAYWQIFQNEFINYDDNLYITDNKHVKAGLTQESISWAFTTGHTGNWHPLTWLSHMLDIEIYGLQPWGHHFMNLLFHIANTLLIFFVLKRMSGAIWQSAFVAALFAIHPLHVESVAWASERKDVLSTLFWMLTMWAYVKYVEHPKILWYLLASLCLALGLMAKPMLVTLPFVLLLMDYWPLGRFQRLTSIDSSEIRFSRHSNKRLRGAVLRRLLLEKIPFLALVLVSSLITFIVQQRGGSVSSLEILPLKLRVANAVVAYVGYIGKMIWPSGLTIFYPHPYDTLPIWKVAGEGLLLAICTFVAVWTFRRRPYVTVGWLWYIGTLIPVIGLVQVGAQSMADRYTYVPLVGLFIIIAWGISDLVPQFRSRRIALVGFGAALLVTLTLSTTSQVSYWRDSIALFSRANEVTHENWTAHLQLGVAETGRKNYSQAITHYRQALRLRPYHVDVHYGLGTALAAEGKMDEAISHYKEALRLKPDYARVHNDLGVALGKEGRLDEATVHYSEALRLEPDYAEAHNNFGIVLGLKGERESAMVRFSKALEIDPKYAEAHNNLGILLTQEGKYDEAIHHYSEAIRLKPDNPEAQKNLDLALAKQKQQREAPGQASIAPGKVSEDAATYFHQGLALFNKGQLSEAMTYFSQALRLKPDYWEAHFNVGAILHRQGKVKEAIDNYSKAIRINPNYPEARYNLGLAFHHQGDLPKAIAEYTEALRIKPNYPQARNNFGVALYNQGKIREAIAQYNEALRLKPDYAEARKNLAVAQAALEQNRKR